MHTARAAWLRALRCFADINARRSRDRACVGPGVALLARQGARWRQGAALRSPCPL